MVNQFVVDIIARVYFLDLALCRHSAGCLA